MNLFAAKDVFANPLVADKLISIYCIAGRLRSGKSFILGLFLKYLFNGGREDWMDNDIESSFVYSNREERVTTGICIYSEPIIMKNRRGDDVAVFLMDTQGWHDDKTPKKVNELIFGLSALLSAVVIFNIDKTVGEDDLTHLQNYTNTAQTLAMMGHQPFQRLFFLIRNWISIDEEEGFPFGYYDSKRPREFRDFIKHKFDPNNLDRSDEAKKIRRILHLLYERMSAYLMPYPGNCVYSKKIDNKKLDQEFIFHINNLCAVLFDKNNLEQNYFNGKYLRGCELYELIKNTWSKDFRLEALTSRNDGPDETLYRMAYETAKDYFNKMMNNLIRNCKEITDLEDLIEFQRLA